MIAAAPTPPYVAVIFTSVRTDDDEAAYRAMAMAMERLAALQPGYLGIESVREANDGITISYWRSESDAAAWKSVAEHQVAQRRGRDQWYQRYCVRIATVTRSYEGPT